MNTQKILKLAQQIVDIAGKNDDAQTSEQEMSSGMMNIVKLLNKYPMLQPRTLAFIRSSIAEAESLGVLERYKEEPKSRRGKTGRKPKETNENPAMPKEAVE